MKTLATKSKKEVKAQASQPFDAPAVPVALDTGIVNKKLQNTAVFLSDISNIHLPQLNNNVFYFNIGVSPYFAQHKELSEVLATLSESYPGLPRAAKQRGLVVVPMILRSTSITASFNGRMNPALAEAQAALTAAKFVVGKL